MNHYEVLGVGPDATEREIKEAYRVQAMKWHPDRHSGAAAKGEADRRFKDLAVAHRTLRNAVERANYDRQLEQQLHREYNNRQQADAKQQEHAQQEHARAQASQKQDRQDPPKADFANTGPQFEEATASDDDANQMFYEQMLDLATELADRGFPEFNIFKALVALGCPETLAKVVAATVAKSKKCSDDSFQDSDKSNAGTSDNQKKTDAFTIDEKIFKASQKSVKTTSTGIQIVKVLTYAVVLLFLIEVAIDAYQDYTRRAKVAEGFEIGSEAARNVGNFYAAQQKGPSDLSSSGFSLTPSSTVRNVAFESQTGLLTVSFHDYFFDAKSLLLVPKVSDGKITWLCTSTGISSAYLPQSCIATQAEANASLAAIAASAQAEAAANLAYRNALSLIEQQHPELNPDATVFNTKAMDWVAARMRVLQESGQTPVNALQWAVADYKVALRQNQSGQVYGQTQSNRPQVPPYTAGNSGSISASRSIARESRSNCQFKEVMTDADYRTCGLQPPQNQPTTTSTPSAANNYDVIDKGGHTGFPEKCRWVTPSEWSCK